MDYAVRERSHLGLRRRVSGPGGRCKRYSRGQCWPKLNGFDLTAIYWITFRFARDISPCDTFKIRLVKGLHLGVLQERRNSKLRPARDPPTVRGGKLVA